MKRLFTAIFLNFLFSCKNGNLDIDPSVPAGSLYEIKVSDKISSGYEYENGILVREKEYGACETPYSITQYNYKSGTLVSYESSYRGIYSSNSRALCDANGAFEKDFKTVKYDNLGRVSKILLKNTEVRYEYEDNQISKHITENGSNVSARVHYLKYDTSGNLIEEKTPDPANGGITRYKYDEKPNPLYFKYDKQPKSAFTSPNNVVKAYDAAGRQLWERKFTYNAKGLPESCVESNGITYSYVYK